MTSVTVLSPHRDDAVFSVGRWMRRWADIGLPVSVLNFYTQTDYAPQALHVTDVTSRRAYEDSVAIRGVSPNIEVRAFGLLDAPLRFGQAVSNVMQRHAAAIRSADVTEIQGALKFVARDSLVLAPLGIGGHIDHLTVRLAALESFGVSHLGFYEDLPYAAWASDGEIRERVLEVQRAPLRRIRSFDRIGGEKPRWVARYRSQIGREDVRLISWRPEMIWIPTNRGSITLAAKGLQRTATPH